MSASRHKWSLRNPKTISASYQKRSSRVPDARCGCGPSRDGAPYAHISWGVARRNYVGFTLYAISIPLAHVTSAITRALAFLVGAIHFMPNVWLGEAKATS